MSLQPDNAVRIKTFEGDLKDREIYFMSSFCKQMAQVNLSVSLFGLILIILLKSKEVRPVVSNLYQYFQNEKFNHKQFELLSTNRQIYDQLATDDLEEFPMTIPNIKIIEKPLVNMKRRIKYSMENISSLGLVDERRSRIILDSQFSGAKSPVNQTRVLQFDTIL